MKTEIILTRRHDLDWLRFVAILVLLFFHTGMWFNTFDWHVKNTETTAAFDYWMIWMHFWRMPLLLFISGAGTYLALGKRSVSQFAVERIKRLFVPLVFGMFVIVPPQIYFEHINEYKNFGDFYQTVFAFVRYPEGSFSWHHLWFIAYLLLYSFIAIPLLLFVKSPKSKTLKTALLKALSSPFGMLFIPALFILITQFILRPYYPMETHGLFNDWAYFVFYACFFLFGILFYAEPQLWNAIRLNRRYLLLLAVLAALPFYGGFLHLRKVVQLPLTVDLAEKLFDISALFVSWFTVITVIGYGQHYLNKPRTWLKYVNEGLYPFYILHQTVIIWIGYYVCQLDWRIAEKYWAISLLTLLSCVSFYLICIRPFKWMRFLFGMKQKIK